jgi:hypothetical protein
MPTYVYECPEHSIFQRWMSIHSDSTHGDCPICGYASQKIQVPPLISVNATPNKGASAREIQAREDRWDKDMPAYKRLRNSGLQPRGVDGSAELEARGTSRLEIEMGRIAPDKDSLREGEEVNAAMQSARDSAKAVGEWFRGEKKAVEI